MPSVPDDVLAEFTESLEPAPREVIRETTQSLERDALLYEDLLRRSVEERSTVRFSTPRPPYEAKIDFAAIAETLDEVEHAGRERLLAAMTAVRDSLLNKLEKRERLTLDFVSELDLKMLGGVDRALRDMVRDAFGRGLGGEVRFSEDPGLYVARFMTAESEAALRSWAEKSGITNVLPPGKMHVTVLYSTKTPDPEKYTEDAGDRYQNAVIQGRSIGRLGDEGAVVLFFDSKELARRRAEFITAGAVPTHDEYRPHVTLTYSGEVPDVEPYDGILEFGPESFAPIIEDWKSTFKISGPQFSPESALAWLEAKALTSTATTNEAILGSVKQVLLQALKTGELLPETMEKIKNVFSPYLGSEVTDANPHRLETIVRTNATEAFNQGRLVEGRNNSLVVAFEYSAIMDARTTPICAALDGKVFRKGDPALDRVIPPNHYNCRSVLVPILADEDIEQLDLATSEEVGKALDLISPGFGGAATSVKKEIKQKPSFDGLREEATTHVVTRGKETRTEHLVWVDNSGRAPRRVDGELSGSQSFVQFSESEKKWLSNKRNKVVGIHNHPSGTSLSGEDITALLYYDGLTEVIASSSKEGFSATYSIRKLASVPNWQKAKFEREKMSARMISELKQMAREGVLKKEVGLSQSIDAVFPDVLNQEFTRAVGGIEYVSSGTGLETSYREVPKEVVERLRAAARGN